MSYRLARHVEHDPKSWDFPADTAPITTVTWAHPGPILDQGQVGSCTGNALADCLNTLPLYKSGPFVDEKAAIAIYSWATHHDGIPGTYPKEDTGSSGIAACKAGKHLGLLKGYKHAFGIEHTLGALMLQPVMIGIPWYTGMFDPDGDGFLNVTGKVEGGHEIAIIGCDSLNQSVTVLNSWGSSWGINGFALLRWSDLERLLAEQGDCTVPLI
jgi:hypothetical protein